MLTPSRANVHNPNVRHCITLSKVHVDYVGHKSRNELCLRIQLGVWIWVSFHVQAAAPALFIAPYLKKEILGDDLKKYFRDQLFMQNCIKEGDEQLIEFLCLFLMYEMSSLNCYDILQIGNKFSKIWTKHKSPVKYKT